MTDNYMYQAVVLGGGPGGYQSAIRLAQYHIKTALIEADKLGGTCLNRGCIPTKALLAAGNIYHQMQNLPAGLTASDISYDYSQLASGKDQIVAKLGSGIAALLKGYGVEVISGYGRLVDAHSIAVNDRLITAENIIIATGSRPARIPVSGAADPAVLTSDDFLQLTQLAASWVIIGGGVIGIETATILAQFNIPVTVIEMAPQILPGVDSAVLKWLLRDLKRKGITVISQAAVSRIEQADGGAAVTYEKDGQSQTVRAERCLLAVGRTVNTADIGLDKAGLAMNKKFIVTDECLRTSQPNIYAIGDVTGRMALAHAASAQGLTAAANIAGRPQKMDDTAIPACIYTNPEIAYVGESAAKMTAEGRSFITGSFNILANGRALIEQAGGGVVCLYADPVTHQLLGGQIMAPQATEMIGELTAAIRGKMTAEQLAEVIHAHPTVAESIKAAAEDIFGMNTEALPARR